jgi:DNA-binding NarL/FixJ family response regulator
MANIARIRGQFERAAILLATVDSGATGDTATYAGSTTYDGDCVAVRAQLGEDAFAEAWTRGKAMTPAQTSAYALADADPPETVPPPPSTDLMTARELEILRLVAEGYTNAEIADHLVLAKSTVKWHVNHIFSKLDATSRTQAVARARDLGLLP